MRGVLGKRIVLLALAAASLGHGQSIVSLLSGRPGNELNIVSGITSGANLPNGFTFYINGTFNPNAFLGLDWVNTSTNVTTTFGAASAVLTTDHIQVTIPPSLFATIVSAAVPVTIKVRETGGTATATYYINPPLQAVQPFMPAGTRNQPYGAAFATGGTAPYDAGVTSGNVPPGLDNFADPLKLSGTPTQTGVFNFQTTVTDYWLTSVGGDTVIEIVDVPTITQLTPAVSGTGAGNLTMTVNGTNFVDQVLFASQTLPGSQVQWKANGVLTPLVTTYVSATQLSAVVPSSLLATAVNAGVAVQQPSPAGSGGLPFAVLGPTVSNIVPTGVPAGSNATTLTVTGANFTINGNFTPTVSFNGIALATTYVNSGQLTAIIPAALLATSLLSPTVTVASSQNPSSAGQALTFTATVATPTTGSPTGTVTFKDGTVTVANAVALSAGGTATFSSSALSSGTHSITAVYSGDANFAPNTSAAVSQVVSATSTSMTLTSSRAVPTLGSSVSYKVTLTNATGVPPQGTVTINEGAATLCNIASLAPGTSSSSGGCVVTYDNSDAPHGAGSHNLTAQFTPLVQGSIPASATLLVNVVSGTAIVAKPASSSGDVYDYGFATSFTSIVTPSVAIPVYTGVVNFFDGTVLIASATPSSTTGAAITPSLLLTAGTHTITAQYSGDFFYGTSGLSAPLTVTVNTSISKPYIVQVTNPGGSASNTVPFFVLPPGIVSLSTTSVAAGSPNLALTLTGVNYIAGSQVLFRGSTLTPTSTGSTTMTVTVPAALLTTPGLVNVQVINPGGTLSNFLPFNVLGPTLASVSPASLPVGSASFGLAVTGANFVSGSQIVFKGTALTTTFGNSGALSATVPANLVTSVGPVNVGVSSPGGATSTTLVFNVVAPLLSGISPLSVPAGSPSFNLAVVGANFVPGAQVLFDGNALTTTFGSATSLTATVPGTLVGAPRVASITVANPGALGNVTTPLTFTVVSALSIFTSSLPPGVSGSTYGATLIARAGTPPYAWFATGLPPGLGLDSASGLLSGVILAGGTYTVNVTVQDSAKSSASAQFTLLVAPPPVSIGAANVSLPPGTVGVPYLGFVSATGGTSPYTFSIGSGHLPDGLTISGGGTVSGTPKTPGQFAFAVSVADGNGNTTSRDTSITIAPPPLTITGGPATTPVVVGTPATITFTGTGGTPPYRFTPCGTIPPGFTFSNGVFSGTPTSAGTYTLCVVIADSTGATVTKNATLTVTETPPTVKVSLGGSLADGKVGVAYSAQITATGGTAPYTYAGSGLPDGLSLSASGAVSGTPGTAGQFSFSATATDSKGETGSGTFSISIAPADISIVTASLPDGMVGVAYSATLSATGGDKAYTWTVSGLPDGLTATAAGVISGTPKTAGKSTVTVSVQDSTGSVSARRTTLSLTIVPASLVISTSTAPNGTAGAAYAVTLTALGGTAPFTFSATGLPAGLSISATGVISGTPTTPGNSTIVVTVKDATGATATKTFAVTVGLPSTPPLVLAGVSDTSSALQQPRLQVSLGNSFPVDVVVTLTMTFAPDSGADDPSIQFSSGGRTARITVPAGATSGATDLGVQTGSVAGLITITAQMQAAGQDVTPSPAPRRTIRIAAGAPVIVPGTLTAVRNATGFTVTLSGYVTDREMTQAVFVFTPAAGSNLQTTTLTVSIDALFTQYFGGTGAAATGSQFTFTQPFTVTGSTQSIASVTVTLVNKIGQSTAVTANLN